MSGRTSFVLRSEADDGIVYTWPPDQTFPLTRAADGQFHLELAYSNFPFASVVGVRGLALEVEREVPRYAGDPHPRTIEFRCHGMRSLGGAREDGYDMRGRVKVGGRRARAFTSSVLLRLDGKLESIPVLYCCRPRIASGA